MKRLRLGRRTHLSENELLLAKIAELQTQLAEERKKIKEWQELLRVAAGREKFNEEILACLYEGHSKERLSFRVRIHEVDIPSCRVLSSAQIHILDERGNVIAHGETPATATQAGASYRCIWELGSLDPQ